MTVTCRNVSNSVKTTFIGCTVSLTLETIIYQEGFGGKVNATEWAEV